MRDAVSREVFYLSSSLALPESLSHLENIEWRWVANEEVLKSFLVSLPIDKITDTVWVVVTSKFLTLNTLEIFLGMALLEKRLSFIFLTDNLQKTIKLERFEKNRIKILSESQSSSVGEIIFSDEIQAQEKTSMEQFDSRKYERSHVKSKIILKKQKPEGEPLGRGEIQYLQECQLNDISPGGARILVAKGILAVTDFIVLIFQDKRGEWLTVESQVRWMASSLTAYQDVGVQFLKVKA